MFNPQKKIYIIAEAGVSHFGSLNKGKKLIKLAKKSGADAVKFQAYLTNELIDKKYKKWFLRYKQKEINFNFLKRLKNYANKLKIDFLCTPHSDTAINWVKKLRVPIIKIGSGELGNYSFLEKIIKLNKPIIISTGMHNLNDMKQLKLFFKSKKYLKVFFLKCNTQYPTLNSEINLLNFTSFKEIFKNFIVGYSDHTNHDLAILGSIVLGARIIEKHISLDFNVKNAQDWKVSFDEKKMTEMVKKIRELEMIMGKKQITISKNEIRSKAWATKSIYIKNNIKKGDIIFEKNLAFKRPGIYIPVSKLEKVIKKKAKKNLFKNNYLKKNDF